MSEKLLYLDVDGTIVAREGELYDGVEKICFFAYKNMWKIALCSARPICSLENIANRLIGIDWVCGLGGMVIAKRQITKFNHRVWRTCYHAPYLNQFSVQQIFEWADRYNQNDIWVYDSKNWFVTNNTPRVQREQFITSQNPIFCTSQDLIKYPLLKIVFPHIDVKLFESLRKRSDENKLIASYSTDTQVEINCLSSYDKGVGKLKKLIFNENNVFSAALGDGANDEGMLIASDLPMTFSDGHDNLKKIAKYILSNDRKSAFDQLSTILSEYQ